MGAALLPSFFGARVDAGDYKYPFQNPDLPIEIRLNNLLSLMTLKEKIACLGTNPSMPRQTARTGA